MSDSDNPIAAFDPSSLRPGWVYILTNESMPGVVKIGRSSHNVEMRARELYQTGVPEPFEVYSSVKTGDCVQLEAYLHAHFAKCRVSKGREFFRADPGEVLVQIKYWAAHQAADFLSELFDGSCAIPQACSVSQAEIERLALELHLPTRLIADAMEMVTAEELGPAILRATEAETERHRQSLYRIDADVDGMSHSEIKADALFHMPSSVDLP